MCGGHQDWGLGHAAAGRGIRPDGPYRRGVGEHKSVRILRALGVAALVAASATALSSCSQLGATPAAPTSSRSGDVVDPSVPSATPTETVASDTPAPIATPVATSAPTASSDARAAVVPFITTADWDATAKVLDVSAIVPGAPESGGTCTVSLTSGSATQNASTTGVAASSYTGCPAVELKDLAAGSYQVRVRYSSATSVGSSAARTVQVG